MKKQMKYLPVLLIIALICAVTVSACAATGPDNAVNAGVQAQPAAENQDDSPDTDDTQDPGDDNAQTIAAGAEPEALSMEKDMGISVNGVWFPIWDDVSGLLDALVDALDEDYEMSSAPSCVFEGEDKEFDFDGLLVLTNPDGARDLWYGILLTGDTFATSRGIRVGSHIDDVMTAYGENYFREGQNIITYSISGIEGDIASPCIQFIVEDEHVTEIEIYYPTNVT